MLITAIDPKPRFSSGVLCWAFFVPLALPSLNDRVHNAKAGHWKYKKQREEWCAAVRKAANNAGVAKAVGRRTLTVRRFYKGRQQERDYVNLVGGCKVVVDALVLEGLLVDDSPALLEDRYEQMRVSKEHESGTWFVLSEDFGLYAAPGAAQSTDPQSGGAQAAKRAPARAEGHQRGLGIGGWM